jgi:hypothetical protein
MTILQPVARLFAILWGWIWIIPIFVSIVGGVLALRAQRRRWIIHMCVFGCMLSALPAFIFLNGIIDPTTVEGPGPGDAFVALFYLLVMVLVGLGYSIFAGVLFWKRWPDTRKKTPLSKAT